jgi:hypothetical protein
MAMCRLTCTNICPRLEHGPWHADYTGLLAGSYILYVDDSNANRGSIHALIKAAW